MYIYLSWSEKPVSNQVIDCVYCSVCQIEKLFEQQLCHWSLAQKLQIHLNHCHWDRHIHTFLFLYTFQKTY